MMRITRKVMVDLVREKTGLDVVIDTPEPIVHTGVSMVPFGQLGTIYVYRDQDGVFRGIPVPFSIHTLGEAEAA